MNRYEKSSDEHANLHSKVVPGLGEGRGEGWKILPIYLLQLEIFRNVFNRSKGGGRAGGGGGAGGKKGAAVSLNVNNFFNIGANATKLSEFS